MEVENNQLQPLKTFVGIAVAFIGYFAILSFSNAEMLNLNSLLISYFAGLLAIFIMVRFVDEHARYKNLLIYACIFFSLRMFVGVAHYLYFFESDYLVSYSSTFDYLPEYVWALDSMNLISGVLNGSLDADSDHVLTANSINKNYEMLFFMSLLFYFGGDKVLVVASFNSLVTLFSAFLVYKISYYLRRNIKTAFFCFTLVAMQPMEFISSILARDIFGQFIIIAALYLMLSYFYTDYLKYFFILVSSILVSFVRDVYALIPIIAVFSPNIADDLFKRVISKKTIVGIVVVLVAALISYDFVINNILYRFLDKDFFALILALPVSLVYALVGPFPWTQIFLQPPGYEYHIPGYLTSIYNFALMTSTALFFIKYKAEKIDYFILIFIFLFFLSGILVYGGHHTTYYSVAIPLLALFDKDSKFPIFFIRFFIIFMFWVLMNIVYTLVT